MQYFYSILDSKEIKTRNENIVMKKLNGWTMQKIGDECGVSRERVRQVIRNVWKNYRKEYMAEGKSEEIVFAEDAYKHLFETFYIPKDVFTNVLQEDPRVYEYLYMFYDAGKEKFGTGEIPTWLDFDEKTMNRIGNLYEANDVVVYGERIPYDKDEILMKIVKHSPNGTTKEQLAKDWTKCMDENPLAKNAHASSHITMGYLERFASIRQIIRGNHTRLRYYDIVSVDFDTLYDELHLGDYKNIEISALKFFNMYGDLMKKYDLRDEYELHNLIRKKIVGNPKYEYIKTERMPYIMFGEFDRGRYVAESLEKHNGDMGSVYRELCSELGIRRNVAKNQWVPDWGDSDKTHE